MSSRGGPVVLHGVDKNNEGGRPGVSCRRRWMMVGGGWWLLSFLPGGEPTGRRKSGVGLGDGGVKVDMWAAAISEDDDGRGFSPGERKGDGNVKREQMREVEMATMTVVKRWW
ncbi:hypothetical protein Dimus_033622 [Dionaea muscipula]